MSLKWIEGFELMGNSASMPTQLSSKYTVSQNYSLRTDVAGRFGGYALALGKGSTTNVVDSIITPKLGDHDTWFVGFNFKRVNANAPDSTGYLLRFRGNSSNAQCALSIAANAIELINDVTTTTITSISVPSLGTDWHHLQIKIVCHPSNGSIQIILDGIVYNEVAGVATSTDGTSIINNFKFNAPGHDEISINSEQFYIDDIWICTDEGETNNNFLGQLMVEGIVPQSNGYLNDWTASNGTNAEDVSEIPANESDYVSSATINNIDSYAVNDLNNVKSRIKGIQVNALIQNIGAGTPTIRTFQRISGNNYENSTHSVTSSAFTTFADVVEANPMNLDYWNKSVLNDMELGIKIIS